jgi:uncharacterized protein
MGRAIFCLLLSVFISSFPVASAAARTTMPDPDIFYQQAQAAYKAGNDAQARTFFSQSCSNNYYYACIRAAELHKAEKGQQNTAAAFKYLQFACDKDFATACIDLGTLHRTNAGDAPNGRLAQAAYKKACGLKDGMGCEFYANTFRSGTQETDPDKFVAAMVRACNYESATACYFLGHRFLRPPATPARTKLARRFFRQGCTDKNTLACSDLAMMHVQGIGSKTDLPRARQIYAKACDTSITDSVSCTAVGLMQVNAEGGPQDMAGARANFKRACVFSSGTGCFMYAKMLMDGAGGATDVPAAHDAFATACRKYVEAACVLRDATQPRKPL